MTNKVVRERSGLNDWMTIKFNSKKSYPFGMNHSNVWNHEWTEQFISYSREEERVNKRKYWTEEMIPLFKEENPDWRTNVETNNRLKELINISYE